MSKNFLDNKLFQSNRVTFSGPQVNTSKVKKKLIYLKPQPSFTSTSDSTGTTSIISLSDSDYDKHQISVDDIMKEFGYSKDLG